MVSKKLVEIKAPEKYLSVTWQVNNFCNFSCTYCNPGNWIGDSPNEGNTELYIANIDKIIAKYKARDYKQFKFFFSGGEPTAWKNFIPICEHLKEILPDCTIAVNTNLSRPRAWWEKHLHLFDDVVASFHVEQSKKEQYAETSIYLCDKLNYMSSKILLHDERFWECVAFGEHLKKVMPNYFIEWTPLYDELSANAGPWEYKDPKKTEFIEQHSIEQEETIENPNKRESGTASYTVREDGDKQVCTSNNVIVDRENFFTGWNCDIGDCVFISPVGEVSLASCGLSGVVGHILDDISKVGPKTITCTKFHCMCGTDIIIPKRYNADTEVIAVGID